MEVLLSSSCSHGSIIIVLILLIFLVVTSLRVNIIVSMGIISRVFVLYVSKHLWFSSSAPAHIFVLKMFNGQLMQMQIIVP
jgi:hypothetical protein